MKSISGKQSNRANRITHVLLVTIFLAVGSGLFIFLTGVPVYNWSKARHWAEIPCTILSSEVGVHIPSDGGKTYSVDISYRYEWDGVIYDQDDYDFMKGSSSGRASKEAIVALYPAGSERRCFVDPGNPQAAVLNRSFSATYLFGSLGLIFVFIAFAFIVHNRRKRGREQDAFAIQPLHQHPSSRDLPLVLVGGSSVRLALFIFLIIAFFWNSVVFSVFWGMYGEGIDEWMPVLFLTPFVLIGLALFAAVGYFLLAYFNPRPTLVLTPGYLPLGQHVGLTWSFRGNTRRIRRLRITLRGIEKATYGRGTTTVTDTSTFESIVLIETDLPREIPTGEISLAIPEFSVPALIADHNKILWQLVVHGEIHRWPDINDEIDVPILPLAPETSSPTAPAEFKELRWEQTSDSALQLTQDPSTLVPGQVIEGTVGWQRNKAPKTAVLRLFWYTEGRGTQDVLVVEELSLPTEKERWRGSFTFTIPGQPYSFQGQLISIKWAIELVLDKQKEVERLDLIVSPWVEQVRLRKVD